VSNSELCSSSRSLVATQCTTNQLRGQLRGQCSQNCDISEETHYPDTFVLKQQRPERMRSFDPHMKAATTTKVLPLYVFSLFQSFESNIKRFDEKTHEESRIGV
jgi:hypothetical protein